jgi:hypothetical protein
MKEFRVNDYITLKLEEELIDGEESLTELKTNIYVKGEKFRQCSFLLINIPVDETTPLSEIESIDEAEERLDTSMEEGSEVFEEIYDGNRFTGYKFVGYRIPPETEFWGHCSNLQVWVEYNYDTRILHRYLAFPLLRKLANVGEPVAKRVFKEEIAKRFAMCHVSVIHFLLFGDYLDNLSEEELEVLFSEVKLRNELFFSYLEPILMVKGYIKHNLTVREFHQYLNEFDSNVEAGKYLSLNLYENFCLQHGDILNRWEEDNRFF